MKTYWYKELASNPFVIAGKPAPFEPLDGNRGVLDVDDAKDPVLAAGLQKAAEQRRGGIVRISAEEYAEKKSLYPLPSSLPPRKDMLVALPPPTSNPFRPHLAGDAPPVAASSEPQVAVAQKPAGVGASTVLSAPPAPESTPAAKPVKPPRTLPRSKLPETAAAT